jgi:uncharacterized membrane protein
MRILRETLSLGAIAGQILLVWINWSRLPERIPTHYGLTGSPDAWGAKSSVLLLPAIAFALDGLLTVLSFFPQIFNYPVPVTDANRPRLQAATLSLLGWLKVEIVGLFAYLTWNTIHVAMGLSSGLGWAFLPLMLGAVGVTVAISVVRMRRAS